MMNSSISVFC